MKVKDCPCCGSQASTLPSKLLENVPSYAKGVYCINEECGLQIKNPNLEKAVEAWNKRSRREKAKVNEKP